MDQFGETCTIEHDEELDECGAEMERVDSGYDENSSTREDSARQGAAIIE